MTNQNHTPIAMRTHHSYRSWVAFPVAIAAILGFIMLCATCVRYSPHQEVQRNSIVSVFKKRVNDAVLNYADVRVVYHTGQTTGYSFGFDRSFNGMIIGYVDKLDVRKRLFASAPFRSCQKEAECLTWGSYREHKGHGMAEEEWLNFSFFSQALVIPSDMFVMGRMAAPSVLAQAKSGRCIGIGSKHAYAKAMNLPSRDYTRDNSDFVVGEGNIICLSPENGAFVYAFGGT